MVLYMTKAICALLFHGLRSLSLYIQLSDLHSHLLSAITLSSIKSVAKHIEKNFLVDILATRNPALGSVFLLMKFMSGVQFYSPVSDLFVLNKMVCLLQSVTQTFLIYAI